MGILLDPNETFEVCLPCDDKKPLAERPVFIARALAAKGQRKLGKAIDALYDKESSLDSDGFFDCLLDLIMQHVVGWKNVGGLEFTRENVDNVLPSGDMTILLRRIGYNQSVQPEEKKSSE